MNSFRPAEGFVTDFVDKPRRKPDPSQPTALSKPQMRVFAAHLWRRGLGAVIFLCEVFARPGTKPVEEEV
jgi:hypothetical protein